MNDVRALSTTDGCRRLKVAVYHPRTQHSAFLAEALSRYSDVVYVSRFVVSANGGLFSRLVAAGAAKTTAGARAVENRRSDVTAHSVDVLGILFGRLVQTLLGRRVRQRYDRRRDRVAGRRAARLLNGRLAVDIVIAAETGAASLMKHMRQDIPVIIDVAHPHPLEVERCRQLAFKHYPQYASSWDDPPYDHSARVELDEAVCRAAQVWVASSYTARSLREAASPPVQAKVLPYGFPNEASVEPRSTRTYRRQFVFLGAVGLRKGVPLLLDAWQKSGLPASGGVLHIVGRSLDEKLERKIADAPGVRRHGEVSRATVRELLATSDALVSPSYLEGFGRVVAEALQFGLPVLATNTGGVPDILTGEYLRWTVSPGRCAEFSDVLRMFDSDAVARRQYVAAAQSLGQHCTFEAYQNRLLSALRDVALGASK